MWIVSGIHVNAFVIVQVDVFVHMKDGRVHSGVLPSRSLVDSSVACNNSQYYSTINMHKPITMGFS